MDHLLSKECNLHPSFNAAVYLLLLVNKRGKNGAPLPVIIWMLKFSFFCLGLLLK